MSTKLHSEATQSARIHCHKPTALLI